MRCITTRFAETHGSTAQATFPIEMKNMTPTPWSALRAFKALLAVGLLMGSAAAHAQETKPEEAAKPEPADVGTARELKLPGLTLHAKERYIDVDARVCLDAGYLELIACTKDSKEHESIIAVDAKPSHMHAALLLLRAEPGNPAIARKLEDGRWLDIPPRGAEVDVFLVFKDDKGELKERPISDFIQRAEEYSNSIPGAAEKDEEDRRFPTHTFLFAGSQLYRADDGKAIYLSDESGNVISLSSFGDELLCLPGKHSQDNAALSWEVDPEHLPPVGTKVILRLKPRQPAPAEPQE